MSAGAYWIKKAEDLHCAEKLEWNFPEQKRGCLKIIGGNSAGFASEVKISGLASEKYKFLSEVKTVFPESLKKNFPVLPNLEFYPATESGSFKKSAEFYRSLDNADFGLFLGDFSKNSETAIVVSELISASSAPIMLTRDTIDLVAPEMESLIQRENLTVFGSLVQIQKIFKAVFYPRMILLSQPLVQVVESLHKFTLSYGLAILTFHEGKILMAKGGEVWSFALEKSDYSPISLWNGEAALKASVFLMFNKNHVLESLCAGVEKQG